MPNWKRFRQRGGRDSRNRFPDRLHRRGGPASFCRFDGFASALTETMLVANLALRLDRKIVWDAEKMEVRDCPKGVPLVKRSYRTGW